MIDLREPGEVVAVLGLRPVAGQRMVPWAIDQWVTCPET
jgi:hypothetical protein